MPKDSAGVGDDVRALEAVRFAAEEYGLDTARLKPCVAVVLDGVYSAPRHDCAFVLALELRRMELDATDAERVMQRWARKVGMKQRDAARALRDGLKPKYKPPGLVLKPGTKAHAVLAATCAEVGCPANCTPLSGLYRGPRTETYQKFEQLGWSRFLRKRRLTGASELYRALTAIEVGREIAPGGLLIVNYDQLAKAAGLSKRSVGRNLRALHHMRLVNCIAGAGRYPGDPERKASRIRRLVPIRRLDEKQAWSLYTSAIRPGGVTPLLNFSGATHPKNLSGATPPNIGGAKEKA